jgi:hypothetical protein
MYSLSLFVRRGFVLGELAAEDGALAEGRGGYMACFLVAMMQGRYSEAAGAEEDGKESRRSMRAAEEKWLG